MVTRMIWLSGLSLVDVSSAAMLMNVQVSFALRSKSEG